MEKKLFIFLTLCLTLLTAQTTQKKGAFADISLITDFAYVYQTLDADSRLSSEIPGFTHVETSSAHEHEHGKINSRDGLSLNYAELGISSAVDPYFDLFSVFHISQESIEIEEAFFVTKKLPVGIKAGRFYSNFGRLNAQHHHYWNFTEQPLVYEAMFGAHNLLEQGVAFNYTLPADNYYTFGLEVLRGENTYAFGSQEIHDEAKGIEIEAPAQPSLYVAYVKNSFELGERLTVLDNLSYAYGQSTISHLSDENISSHAFSGTSQMMNLGLTLRYDFSAYSHLSFENEYLYRFQDGNEYSWDANTSTLSVGRAFKEQAGFYSSLVYKIDQNVGLGLRYGAITQNDILEDGTKSSLTTQINRTSAMLEYNPSEFSKIRIEYCYDNSNYINDSVESEHKIIVQFNHIIGTHKAHTF